MMLEIGSIVRARVVHVVPYGVYLEAGPARILVLIPEVSWLPCRDLNEQYKIGEEHEVFVKRYNYRDRITNGSFRRLRPEQNPFRVLARLEPGTALKGRVRSVIHGEATLELPQGAWGRVSCQALTPPPVIGDTLEVTIVDLDVDEGRLALALAAGSAPFVPTSMTSLPTEQPA